MMGPPLPSWSSTTHASVSGRMIAVRANATLIVWFAVVQKLATVPIEQGENKGKTLTYTNIVREMSPVGVWKGKPMSVALARTAIMRPETEACVVLLQDGRGGPIIGAAWAGLW